MKHQVVGSKLNRDIKERKALFKNLIIALITHGKIKTTVAKAKAIRSLAEKLVTRAKDGSSGALRQVSSFLTKKEAINKLTKNIAPRFNSKIGGYVRMTRVGVRKGDNAEEAILEWSQGDPKHSKSLPPTQSEEVSRQTQKKKV